MEEINKKNIFKFLKNPPSFINFINFPNIKKKLVFNDIVNLWTIFKKTNNVYLDNYFDNGYLLNKVFNENIDYNFNKKKINIDKKLFIYKKFLDKHKIINSIFENHCLSKNKSMLIINFKNSDDIFINIKDDNLWTKKIKNYFNDKDYTNIYNELNKGPFIDIYIRDDIIKKMLWSNNNYNRIVFALFTIQ
jgi:hypothetical protein